MCLRKIVLGIIFCCLLSGCFFFEQGFAGPLAADRQQLYRQIIKNSEFPGLPQLPVINRISADSWPEFMPLGLKRLKASKDVIIVLGSKPLDTQTPTIDLVGRVIRGVILLRSLPNSLLVLSGGRTVEGISEAEMMGLIAWSRGVDVGEMILEERARSTDENAQYCAELLADSSADHFFLVSRKDHLIRAIPIFHQFNLFQKIEGKDCGVSRLELIKQIEAYMREHDSVILRQRLEKLRAVEN